MDVLMTDEAAPSEPRPRIWRRAGRAIRRWWRRAWEIVQPGAAARHGATWAIASTTAVAGSLAVITWKPGFGAFLDVVVAVTLAFIALALAFLVTLLIGRTVSLVPRFFTWVGIGMSGSLIVALAGWGLPFLGAAGAVLVFGVLVIEAMLGGALGVIRAGGLRGLGRARQVWLVAVVTAGVSANVFGAAWLLWPGSDRDLVRPPVDKAAVAPLAIADPSKPGPFLVRTLTYGAGTDRWRAEFGSGAGLKTKPVDATPFVKGSEGWRMSLRRWYWGFDFEHFPVNGRVWYPDGPGPFPLVLIVHGNHDMEEFSDPGYAYLGEHLASRGFIFVSVDENFFNSSFRGSLSKENDGRGWMLLQHLEAWKQWNESDGNPFRGKVAMDRIALIGHSRGGEAVAVAGAFNRLRYYPDDGRVEMPSGFGIRSLVAIAPADGQYSPADRYTPLENVNYLTLQGAHDADVSSFVGIRQFARVRFTDGAYHVKAAVYTYRANHGQFNTVWGDNDAGFPIGLFLDRKRLMQGDAQRRVAKVFITAFLDATLLDRLDSLDVLKDERRARQWLPDDVYVTRFADSASHTIADYEEDVDLTTTSLPGARIEQRGLALWREQYLPFKSGTTRDAVAYLGWKPPDSGTANDKPPRAGPPSYSIVLPDGFGSAWGISGESELRFALAQVDKKVPDDETKSGSGAKAGGGKPGGEKKKDEDKKKDDPTRPIPLDLTVELTSADGAPVRLPLSRFRAIPVMLKARMTKLWSEVAMYAKPSEPVLQSFVLPLSAFSDADARFDPATLKTVRLIFDRSPEGLVALDDVAIAPARLK
jgi:dienelactone hydrolase